MILTRCCSQDMYHEGWLQFAEILGSWRFIQTIAQGGHCSAGILFLFFEVCSHLGDGETPMSLVWSQYTACNCTEQSCGMENCYRKSQRYTNVLHIQSGWHSLELYTQPGQHSPTQWFQPCQAYIPSAGRELRHTSTPSVLLYWTQEQPHFVCCDGYSGT